MASSSSQIPISTPTEDDFKTKLRDAFDYKQNLVFLNLEKLIQEKMYVNPRGDTFEISQNALFDRMDDVKPHCRYNFSKNVEKYYVEGEIQELIELWALKNGVEYKKVDPRDKASTNLISFVIFVDTIHVFTLTPKVSIRVVNLLKDATYNLAVDLGKAFEKLLIMKLKKHSTSISSPHSISVIDLLQLLEYEKRPKFILAIHQQHIIQTYAPIIGEYGFSFVADYKVGIYNELDILFSLNYTPVFSNTSDE